MEFTLKRYGVETEDRETLISHYKKTQSTLSELDEMLERLGYMKIFTDDIFGWMEDEDEDGYDDSFSYSEKNHHRPQWVD